MDKPMFDELLASVREMDQIIQGKKSPARCTEILTPNVKLIRERVGLSQRRFALLIGVSQRTLENWEQGRRQPTGPARVLLKLLENDPEHVLNTLHR